MLNKIAFEVYRTEQTITMFQSFFLDQLKEVLESLVYRDSRLNIFEDGFWVVDKGFDIAHKELSFKKIA